MRELEVKINEGPPGSVVEAEAAALRLLAAPPEWSPRELQRALEVDNDSFLDAWERRAPLPPEARRRLLELLDREQERLEGFRSTLQDEPDGESLR